MAVSTTVLRIGMRSRLTFGEAAIVTPLTGLWYTLENCVCVAGLARKRFVLPDKRKTGGDMIETGINLEEGIGLLCQQVRADSKHCDNQRSREQAR